MRIRPIARLVFALGAPALGAAAAEPPLKVRASVEAAPCVLTAVRAWGQAAEIETGALRDPGPVDVLVGAGVEINRALEGGRAVVGSEEPVAQVPWVLSVGPGHPSKVTGLGDLDGSGLEVLLLGGPASYEARRALAALSPKRLRESHDAEALRQAPLAIVPVSLAGAGERLAVDIPPIPIGAAVAARAARPEAARAFVVFLASEPGQAAFAACGMR